MTIFKPDKSICFPAKTGLFLWFGPSDNFKQTAYGEAVIATIINASYDIIDLTSSAYPTTCLKIMEKFEKGIAANIYIKENVALPQQAVIQVQKQTMAISYLQEYLKHQKKTEQSKCTKSTI